MLKSIRLKFGPTPDATPLQFTPGPLTVFIGPGGAGKSLALQELRRSLGRAEPDDRDRKIVADIEPGLPPTGELRDRVLVAIKTDLERLRTVNATDSAILNTLVKVLRDPDVEPETLEEAVSWLDSTGKRTIVEALIEQRKLRTLATTGAAPTGELLPIFTLIQTLIERSDERLIADGIIDLHGYHELYNQPCLSLDAGALLELAADAPLEAVYERIVGDHHFIVIDDLEAFLLQSPLPRQLGGNLGNLAAKRGAYVFAAIDSPDLLGGCIEAGATIIRLGFQDGRPSAQLLAHL